MDVFLKVAWFALGTKVSPVHGIPEKSNVYCIHLTELPSSSKTVSASLLVNTSANHVLVLMEYNTL